MATYSKSKLMEYAFTLKLIEYMAAGHKQLQLYLNHSKLAAKDFDISILAKKEIDIIQKYTNKSFNQGA